MYSLCICMRALSLSVSVTLKLTLISQTPVKVAYPSWVCSCEFRQRAPPLSPQVFHRLNSFFQERKDYLRNSQDSKRFRIWVCLEFFFLKILLCFEDSWISRSLKKLPDGGGVARNTLGIVILCLWQGLVPGAIEGPGMGTKISRTSRRVSSPLPLSHKNSTEWALLRIYVLLLLVRGQGHINICRVI